jgi:hypothetical protein
VRYGQRGRSFYKEAPGRAIRGQASAEEHQALIDEGIPVARIPVPPSDRLKNTAQCVLCQIVDAIAAAFSSASCVA